MDNDFRLRMTFWGVRGSTPTPQIEHLNYGGNTCCIEVRLPNNDVFIFDAGTGVRDLGDSLLEEFSNQNLDLKVFLTHFHWDHIQGIPFFQPLYQPENKVVFHSVAFPEGQHRSSGSKNGLEETLRLQMADPYFPISLESLTARKEFKEIDPEPIKFGKLTITPFPLNHPGQTYGYRIESEGAVIVYATDLEHGHAKLDKVLRDISQNADLLIYDSQFTPEDYKKHKGWGHSTWLEACRAANDAHVKQLALFHHFPSYDDGRFYEIVQLARSKFENTIGAQEGWSLTL